MNGILVAVRYYGGTYIARALNTKTTASCTSSEEAAAKRVAEKAAKKLGKKVLNVERWAGGSTMYWVALSGEAAP
jgi:DNA integrity scanning protein DisA with diadenylate cyclase activity